MAVHRAAEISGRLLDKRLYCPPAGRSGGTESRSAKADAERQVTKASNSVLGRLELPFVFCGDELLSTNSRKGKTHDAIDHGLGGDFGSGAEGGEAA